MANLRDILGQDRAIEVLQAGLRSERIHHSWIFHGPPGVGKRTTAEAFAAVLLDPDAGPNLTGEVEIDEQGRTARLIAAGTHPDLHYIAKELAVFSRDSQIRQRKLLSIPVQVIREFLLAPAYRSSNAPPGARARKVFIIDEAELLAAAAQNALLKTLEEPPAGTVLILVTAHAHRLLPTTRSRCQRVAFTPLCTEAMDTWLSRWQAGRYPKRRWFAGVDEADLEEARKTGKGKRARSTRGAPGDAGAEPPSRPALNEAEREWVKRFAQGSPGLAELAIERGFHEWYTELHPMLAQLDQGGYPAVMGSRMAGLVDAFAIRWVKEHPNASKESANKAGARYLFILLAEEIRLRLRDAVSHEEQDRSGQHRPPGAGSKANRYIRALDLIRRTERNLESNVNMGLAFDDLVIQWARIDDEIDDPGAPVDGTAGGPDAREDDHLASWFGADHVSWR